MAIGSSDGIDEAQAYMNEAQPFPDFDDYEWEWRRYMKEVESITNYDDDDWETLLGPGHWDSNGGSPQWVPGPLKSPRLNKNLRMCGLCRNIGYISKNCPDENSGYALSTDGRLVEITL